MNKYNDDFIAHSIIESDYLVNEKYKTIIEELKKQTEYIIDPPTSDLDPYYIIRTKDNKIKLKASYIGDVIIEENKKYIKWSWSRPELSKASKINSLKILKYFLDQEPSDTLSVFYKVNSAFVQSVIKIDNLFYEILVNALLHIMKHKFEFELKIIENKLSNLYLIKEIL